VLCSFKTWKINPSPRGHLTSIWTSGAGDCHPNLDTEFANRLEGDVCIRKKEEPNYQAAKAVLSTGTIATVAKYKSHSQVRGSPPGWSKSSSWPHGKNPRVNAVAYTWQTDKVLACPGTDQQEHQADQTVVGTRADRRGGGNPGVQVSDAAPWRARKRIHCAPQC
jgi:hypothetical protein